MSAIERELALGKTAIMLVPEIGLTPQVLGNFRHRFGDNVAILHSGLTVGERYDEWYRLFTGAAKIVIGARSAVFAPLENIGIIIIDEEHDGSYYAESNPRFCTHDIAEMRCAYWGAALVLGSATPSVSTFQKTKTGAYKLLTLDKRIGELDMPTVEIVDMSAEMRAGNGGIFSRAFLKELGDTIENGKQAIIFLNRRGFSSFVMCKSCGWVAKCEHCDVSLVYHKDDRQLKCHYCSARFSAVGTCPKCGSGYLKFGSTGTQKVAEELKAIFPTTEIFRLDADNIKNKDELIDTLDRFAAARPAVLVGTQMVAKGHHFPDVALVGIIDADNALHHADYRAVERTFALITQVAGRCGRERGSVGRVVLQTFIPNHYVYRLAANYDYARFFEKEINTRAVTKYPPFTTIVRILITGERDDKIKDVMKNIMLDLRTRAADFVYLGAMRSPLGRLEDRFRYQILCRISTAKEREVIDFIDTVVKKHKPAAGVSVFLEINPQSLT
jgi:primosomal protein N' (replication factor Y)